MTVNIDSADVRVIPECSERIVVTEANPGYSDAGVSRDRAITVTFSKKPSKSSFIFSESEIPADATNKKAVFDDEKNEVPGEFWAYTLGGQTYLKNVSITNSDGISLAEHFLQPELDGNILTVPVDRSNSIEIESGSSLTIVVTISDGVCDDNGVTMNGEKQWRYRATEATDEKATLTLSCENDEGSVYLAGTRDYNISQKITLSFTENADYQFLRWNYDSKIVNIAEPDKINTTAIVVEKTDASEIKAVCAKRLRVSSFSPKIDDKTPSVSKNSSIIITFDHDLPTDAEGYAQLSNISIAVGGSPVKSSFLEPVINGSSVTFAADKTNMLEVPGDQTKTVTVSVPADFFYKTDDGTKVTFGGNGEVFNYKIDSTTLEKAEITFGAAKDSGAITPSAGTYHYSIGSEIPLTFALSDGWQFNGWSVSGADPSIANKIKIADEKALSTKLNVYEALQGVTVTAKTSECLRIEKTSPSAKTNPKDSSIIITFNKPLAGECSSLLNKIRISSDGNSLDSYYTDRSISEISGDNGDFKQITIKNTSYLSVPKNSTKIITVTVPSDFYYNDGDTKIKLEEDSFSFTIDHTTEAKTGITYKVVNGEDGSSLSAGTINRSSYEEYNIGEEVELSLDLYSGYQFYGWDITDSSGYSVTDQISYVNSNSSYLAPTLSINKPADGITVSAICYKRPTISTSSVAPYSSNSAEEVAKNTPIVLTFDHAISDETKDEIIVTYSAISNFNKDSYFSTSISNDNKTVTLTPIKMLPLEHAYETVTVTVPCQKVYYLASDGRTKITPADKDFSWSYRVNNSTLTKTVVRFETNDASVTGRQINVAGALLSSGTTQPLNVEQTLNLEFPVADGYKFAGWKVESATTGYTVEPAGYVTSGTIIVKNDDKSYFTLVIDGTNPAKAVITSNDAIGNGTGGYGITVLAKDVLLPAINEHTPSSENINPKDSTITIKFNKNLAESCSASLDLIKITMNGNDVSGFFEKRELKNNVITIKNTSLLDVTGSATKKITVTVPAVFYYEPEEGFRAYLSKEESFEYKIDSSTANKTKIRFDSSENSKKTLKVNEASTNDGGTLAYNRGETVKLEYEVPAGYKFAGWKIVSPSSDYTVSTSDYVTSGTITVKNGDDTYLTLKVDSDNPVKAVVEIADAIEDYETSGYGIRVLAKDVLLPKITAFTPAYSSTGVDCDTPVTITFNKSIENSTVTCEPSGTIQIVDNSNDGEHYESYFNTPTWNENTVTIKPKYTIKNLVANGSSPKTLKFKIDLSGITDSDGNALTSSEQSFTYRINDEMETEKPLWYGSPVLYSDNTSSKKTLNTAAFSSWSSATTGSYKKGTYSQNHVGNSVYYTMYGYDMGSGVKSLRITETYYLSDSGASVTSTSVVSEKTGIYYSSSYNGLYKYVGTYTFKTQAAGVIKLDFQLVDNAGNTSTSNIWYVIKDNNVKMDNIYPFVSDMRRPSNNTDSVTVTILSGLEQDKFYKDFWGDISVEFYWGYSTDSMTKLTPSSTTDNENKYNFSRKADKLTYMKLIATDEVGNTMTSYYHIPPMYGTGNFTIEDGRNGSKWFKVTPYNTSYYENIASSVGANKFCIGYFIIESGKTISWENALEYDCQDESYASFDDYGMQNGETYYVYFYIAFEYANGVKVFSSWSESYGKIVVGKDSNGDNTYATSIVTTNNGTMTGNNYFNDPVHVKTTATKGSGCYTVDVDLTKNTKVKNGVALKYQYSMKAINENTNEVFYNDGISINLPSPGQYKLYMIVKNSNGATKESDWLYCCENGSSTHSTSYSLKFTADLTPPDMGYRYYDVRDSAKYSPPTSLNLIYEEDTSSSTKWSHNYPVDADSSVNSTIYYYILPGGITYCDDSVLAGYTRKKWTFNSEQITWSLPHASTKRQGIITLPYGDIDEGSYTVCVIAKDTNGNEARRFIPVSNRLANEKLNWSYNRSTKKLTPANTCSLYYYDETHSRWIYVDETNAYSRWCRIIGYNYDKGYYNVEYAYLGTQSTCNNKNIMELQNGLQVFCDHSTFVHTLYSSKKLTETNTASDIAIWETKGTETGVKFTSSNFTYGSENLTGVPSGCYYTTVVHFMDGTTLMSEVKQK